MVLLLTILFIMGWGVEDTYSPRLEYVEDSELLVLYYTKGTERKMIKLFKF